MTARRTWRAVAVLIAALTLAHVRADAPDEWRRVGWRWTGGVLRVTLSLSDLVASKNLQKFRSGLPQTTVVRAIVHRTGSEARPLAANSVICRVVYDLWEDTFRIHRQTAHENRTFTVRTTDEVVRECLVLRDLPLGQPSDYTVASTTPLTVSVLAEFNPVSRETVDRIRRWMSRSPGSSRMEGESFFGAFASVFVGRTVGPAERTVHVHSQSIEVP